MENTPRPRDLGLPHDEWREAQYDLYSKTLALHEAGGGVVFGQAPTGVGKSAVAAALGHDDRVLYVASTLGLLDQAEREYGFAAVKGRQEYPCSHEEKAANWNEKGRTPTAADCHYSPMTKCPYVDDCAYRIARDRALASRKMACTYKYLALSERARKRPGILVMDEAHDASSELMAFAEFSIDSETMRYWHLPKLPGDYRGVLEGRARTSLAEWLNEATGILAHRVTGVDEESAKAKRLHDRIERTLDWLALVDWYADIGDGVIERWNRGRKERRPGILLRALGAAPIAASAMAGKDTTLLMSATIGNDPVAIASEMGIADYQFVSYPHPVPWEMRPVFDLGLERMTKENLDARPALLTVQARAIAECIRQWDDYWRGIVLTSSYKRVNILRDLLSRFLPGRVFVPPSNGADTSARIAAFLADPRSGIVAVDTMQGWGHGLDLRGDLARFCVVAGVPFDNPSDPFIRARRKLPGGDRYYWWSAYMSIVQACGRVSRNERTESGGWLLNVAAVADGCATSPKALRHYPEWFRVERQ